LKNFQTSNSALVEKYENFESQEKGSLKLHPDHFLTGFEVDINADLLIG